MYYNLKYANETLSNGTFLDYRLKYRQSSKMSDALCICGVLFSTRLEEGWGSKMVRSLFCARLPDGFWKELLTRDAHRGFDE